MFNAIILNSVAPDERRRGQKNDEINNLQDHYFVFTSVNSVKKYIVYTTSTWLLNNK